MSIFDKIFDPVAAEKLKYETEKQESPAEYDTFNPDIWAKHLREEHEQTRRMAALGQAQAAAKLSQMRSHATGQVEPYTSIIFPDEKSKDEVMDFMSLVRQAGMSVKEVNKMLVQAIRAEGDDEDAHE